MITELKQYGKKKEDMKMKKIFSNITMLAALFVAGAAFTACSNESDDIATIEQPAVNGQKVYTMTIQAGKSGDATTRALELIGNTLTAKWANGDEVTVFNGTTSLGTLTASSTSANGKSCTLSGTLTGEIAVGNTLTLAYHPIGTTLSAIQYAFNAQTGTLPSAAALDCATATVTVASVSGGAITINESSAAFSGQTSVLKLTMQDGSSTAINATSLTVTVGTTDVFTFSSLSPTDGVIYLALPTQAQVATATSMSTAVLSAATITFTASTGSNTYTASKTGYTFAAAKYYGTTLTMGQLLSNSLTSWTGGTYHVPAGGLTYGDAISVTSNVTLVLTDGETLTLNKGISIADGATLTIQGNGTMNVNGTNGADDDFGGMDASAGSGTDAISGSGTVVLTSGTLTATGGKGGNMYDSGPENKGGHGAAGISCALIVNGGTVTATGGNGGSLTSGSGNEGVAGNGGAGISGALTVNGGTLTATGGDRGTKKEGSDGYDGSIGRGISSTWTAGTGITFSDSADGTTWTTNSGTSSTQKYVKAE